MSRAITEAERRQLVTGEKAQHGRSDQKGRQRALDEMYEAMTELMTEIESGARFRQGLAAGESARRDELKDRFSAFGGQR
jgi:uncharacterized FlaG/YvyC family protein